MGKRRNLIRALAALSALCLCLAGLAGCVSRVRLFYTPGELEALLEEKYQIPFTIQHRCPEAEGDGERTYLAVSHRLPGLTFQVTDFWTTFHWAAGRDGVPPVPVSGSHVWQDNCLSVVWNQYAVPILEEYGVFGLSVDASRQYLGLSSCDLQLPRYQVPYAGDLESVAAGLSQLMARLCELPLFQDRPAGTEDFGLPVTLQVLKDDPLLVNREFWLELDSWEEEALNSRLEGEQAAAAETLRRRLEGMGMAHLLPPPPELPVPGRDFTLIEVLRVPAAGRYYIEIEEDWQETAARLRELAGCGSTSPRWPLRGFGVIPVEDMSCLCLAVEATMTTAIDGSLVMEYVLLIDTATGQVYLYGERGEQCGVLADSGYQLPLSLLPRLLPPEEPEPEPTPEPTPPPVILPLSCPSNRSARGFCP